MPVFVELTDRTESRISVAPRYVTAVVPRSGGGAKLLLVGDHVVEVNESREEVARLLEEALNGSVSAPAISESPPATDSPP
jgi:hypothetical protein